MNRLSMTLGLAAMDACWIYAWAVLLGLWTDLQKPMHEEPQAKIGRQAAGRTVRRIKQSRFLQIRHHVANRGRAQRVIPAPAGNDTSGKTRT